MKKIQLFNNFLNGMKEFDPTLMESIKTAFNTIYESEMQQQEPKIRISYETWDEDSVDAGETDDKGWENEEGVSMQPDQYDLEEGLTPVDLAVKFLTDNGPMEASSSHFNSGVWYTNYGEQDMQNGSRTNRSFHLVGFTPEQEEEIFNRI